MQITRFIVNMIEENCYLFWDETGQAALVDCGAFYPEEQKAISDFIESKGLKLTRLLNTHGHFDHIFGASYIYNRYGVPIELCHAEQETYETSIEQMKRFLHRELPLELPAESRYFNPGDELKVGNLQIRVIPTPGHTPGGVCFYIEEEGVLFSGDSLFRHEIGRCDLPGGNEIQLIEGLRQHILTLPENVQVLPGHGDATTIGEEKAANYYLK